MSRKNKLMRSQKGSISMFVIVSVLFFAFILVGMYASYANKLKAQEQQVGEIKENYEKNATEDGMKDLYQKLTDGAQIGDYVTYNVSYTDMYTSYEFTASNGWRILDGGTSNGDGTYSGVKLISTGIPARLYYYPSIKSGTAAPSWWGTDEQVEALYGEEYSAAGYVFDDGGNPSIYAATGLLKNFESIPLTKGNSANQNEGYFKKINSIDLESTYGSIFLETGASEVHNLTLEELNTARELPADDNTYTSAKDGDTGLFYLRDLANENSKYNYTSSTSPYYWITYGSSGKSLMVAFSNGMWSLSDIDIFGVRPVVTLSSKIRKVSEGHWEIVGDTATLPTGTGTTPWLPEGFSQVEGTSLETGLTIANTNDGTAGTQNYVWIEVPTTTEETITLSDGTTKTVKLANAATDEEIALILKAYAGDYTKGASTQTCDYNDEWYDGCGMAEDEYQTAYSNMLQSIQKYGGFWIAQYEAGISYNQEYRTSNSAITIEKANYAQNQYPYNWVTCSQAQQIASEDSVEGKYASSLPFGIQWDLVCRFLEEKNTRTYEEIATNSNWGNYDSVLWVSSESSKYSDNGAESFVTGSYNKNTDTVSILLTTGAIENTTEGKDASPMNIYDLAGNVSEWTLEYADTTEGQPCVRRGGNFFNASTEFQCAHRLGKEVTDCETYTCFRSVLYTVEN
ncbi:MAG: hypothetical protein IJ312_06030 [Treponema sp.]|nr:hypothetical protein [Treponema sp.]